MKHKSTLSLSILVFAVVCSVLFSLTACGKKDKVRIVNFKLTSEEYALCVNRTDSAMLAEINDFLIEIKSNGTFKLKPKSVYQLS